MTRTRTLIASTLLMASMGVAHAAAWTTDSFKINIGTIHSTSVQSTDGNYAMVVECRQGTPFSIWIESPFEWDLDASYAPEVPTTFVVGDQTISDIMFQFDSKQVVEGISSMPESQEALGRLLDAMAAMGNYGEIELTYFDRSTSFPTDGLLDGLIALMGNCA